MSVIALDEVGAAAVSNSYANNPTTRTSPASAGRGRRSVQRNPVGELSSVFLTFNWSPAYKELYGTSISH